MKIEDNSFICSDCMEVLREIPDKKFDLCLTDPPYGVGIEYKSFDDSRTNLKKLINIVMPELFRTCKIVVVMCGNGNQFLYPEPSWTLAWFYRGGANLCSWGFNTWQPILVYGNDPYLANRMGARADSIYREETPKKNGHPCPKPILFWQELLLRVSISQNDLIIDPFCGSGTTAIACHKTGRRFVCIDKEPEYIEIAKKRYKALTDQMELLPLK